MKIDLSSKIFGLDNKEIDNGETVAKLLANSLAGKTEKIEPVKAFDWAMRLFNEGNIEIDRSDSEKLIEEIKVSTTMTNLGKGQIIRKIQECIAAEDK